MRSLYSTCEDEYDDDLMVDNYRPVRPLGDRTLRFWSPDMTVNNDVGSSFETLEQFTDNNGQHQEATAVITQQPTASNSQLGKNEPTTPTTPTEPKTPTMPTTPTTPTTQTTQTTSFCPVETTSISGVETTSVSGVSGGRPEETACNTEQITGDASNDYNNTHNDDNDTNNDIDDCNKDTNTCNDDPFDAYNFFAENKTTIVAVSALALLIPIIARCCRGEK